MNSTVILSCLQVEQLSDHTGEESIILTASVNDGSLSHLGSNTGKGFLDGREEIKSQFLGYCLKSKYICGILTNVDSSSLCSPLLSLETPNGVQSVA